MGTDHKIVVRTRAIIMHEGKLLAVRHAHDPSFCALPGGHLERGEDIKESLKREILEELGVEPTLGRLLYVNNFMDGDIRQAVEFFFEVTNGEDFLHTEHLAKSHAHEIAEVIWLTPGDEVRLLPSQLAEDFKSGKLSSEEPRFIF